MSSIAALKQQHAQNLSTIELDMRHSSTLTSQQHELVVEKLRQELLASEEKIRLQNETIFAMQFEERKLHTALQEIREEVMVLDYFL